MLDSSEICGFRLNVRPEICYPANSIGSDGCYSDFRCLNLDINRKDIMSKDISSLF